MSQSFQQGNSQGWRVEDQAIIGEQDQLGNGGLLLTERRYGDFRIELEVRPDLGMDSGIFLRSTESGQSYQITVDLIPNGRVGDIFAQYLVGFLHTNPNWDRYYEIDAWNHIAAEIQGNPPLITVWINGVRQLLYQDDEIRLPNEGHIGLQVHGGECCFGTRTRVRRIRVTPLN